MKQFLIAIYAFVVLLCGCQSPQKQSAVIRGEKIDRKDLVIRHNVEVNEMDTLASLTVGNGAFAMTVDATGLQTFPEFYENGVSLGTQSDWGWHSYTNTENYKAEESFKLYDMNGRKINYKVQWNSGDRKEEAANYFRVNPHRLHLGIVGLHMMHVDGSEVKWNEIKDIHQKLNMWDGSITSTFTIDGEKVEVLTICDPENDLIATKIKSNLVCIGRVGLKLRFPYPDGKHVGSGCDWEQPDKHLSVIKSSTQKNVLIQRIIDTTNYFVNVRWDQIGVVDQLGRHEFLLTTGEKEITASVSFAQFDKAINKSFESVKTASAQFWPSFWMSGGAVDFTGSIDPRAKELERRIVLSQYLTRIQCAGIYPPQETGLTFNSWYGKFHLEMDWWHGVHFALWNRTDLLEKRLGWYLSVLDKAKAKAKQQGFEGARWAKMTNPNGEDSPSGIGEFLIWQQPHIIYFAERVYQYYNNPAILEKYSDLVFQTAEFMASYAQLNKETGKYDLGPGLIPAQECFKPETTINPPFELAYWRYALLLAVDWQMRMRIPVNTQWSIIARDIAPLAKGDDKYLVAQSAPDTYKNAKWLNDHPMVLGAYGMLPDTRLINKDTMSVTFDYIMDNWNWDYTWGWDYPMVAMCATRLGKPDKAVDALLMDVQKNTYLKNGHNYQDERLRIYLPGNGGLLSAVAMMCAGYTGCEDSNPGFPFEEQGWTVRWENLSPMP